MSLYSILITVLAALLLVFSAGQLGLSAYMVNYWLSRRNEFFNWTTSVNQTYPIYWLPNYNLTRSYILQLVTGVLGVVTGTAVFGLLITNRSLTFIGTGKRAPRTVAWPLTTIVSSLLVFALAFTTLVVSFYDNTNYGPLTIQSVGLCLVGHRSAGYSTCGSFTQLYDWFTMEGWTCRLSPIYSSSTRPPTDDAMTVLPRTCRVAYYSRWWTVAPMLLPLFMIVVALFEMRRKNIANFQEKQEQHAAPPTGERSFGSAATVTPLSPNGTLPQYSAAPELGDSGKNMYETGGKQVMEAPEKAAYDEMPAEQHQVYSELSANRSKVVVGNEANKV